MSMTKDEIINLSIEVVVKLVILGAILYWALLILKPFIMVVIWAIIIAVTLSPLVANLANSFSIKRSKIIFGITLFGVLALVVPTYFLSSSLIGSTQELALQLQEGTFIIPPPPEKVATWPFVGEKIYAFWESSSLHLDETIMKFKPQIREYAGALLSGLGGALGTVLKFVLALIIAAIFLNKSDGSVKIYHAISRRLIGEKGVEWAELSALTVRSVVQGVIGIALIQSILSLIGLILMDVPFTLLWAFIVLFLAIIQLPPLLILGPIAAYVFSYADTTPATIFAVYAIAVSMSDAFLKPLLLGRGVDVPMLVILLGAIGGMILSGIIGLFVGAVVLALAYKLFTTWLDDTVDEVKIFN